MPNVTDVKALSDYVVKFTLNKPRGGFVTALGSWCAGIMSPAAIKKYGVQDVGRRPVGTGRFMFDSQANNEATVVAFPDHWAGRPPLDKIISRAIPDSQALTASLLSGDVDLTPWADLQNLSRFQSNPNLKVSTIPAAEALYFGVNIKYPSLTDVRKRQALGHAINKQQIIDQVYYSQAEIAGGFVSPAMPGAYAPSLKDYYNYDPNKAKALLDQAGGPNDLPIHTMTAGYWLKLAELVQADLNAVGFNATINKLDPATYFSSLKQAKHGIYMYEMEANNPEAEDFLYSHWGCGSLNTKEIGDWCDPNWDRLRDQQTVEKDPEKRKAMFEQLQKILLDNVVGLWNDYGKIVTVMSSRVEGYTPLAIPQMYWDNVYVTKK